MTEPKEPKLNTKVGQILNLLRYTEWLYKEGHLKDTGRLTTRRIGRIIGTQIAETNPYGLNLLLGDLRKNYGFEIETIPDPDGKPRHDGCKYLELCNGFEPKKHVRKRKS